MTSDLLWLQIAKKKENYRKTTKAKFQSGFYYQRLWIENFIRPVDIRKRSNFDSTKISRVVHELDLKIRVEQLY